MTKICHFSTTAWLEAWKKDPQLTGNGRYLIQRTEPESQAEGVLVVC